MSGSPLVMGTTGAGDAKSRGHRGQGNVSKCRPGTTRFFHGTWAWARTTASLQHAHMGKLAQQPGAP